MLSILLTLIALTVVPVLGDQGDKYESRALNRRDEFDEWVWEIDSPTPSEFDSKTVMFDGHETDGDWFAVPTDLGGEDFFQGGAKLGWRLTNDTSSSIIWILSSNNQVANPFFNDTDDLPISLDFTGTIREFYPNTTSNFDLSSPDPWDSTYAGTPVTMNRTVTVQNSECNESLNFTVTTLDAIGTTKIFTGVDLLYLDVPKALPANVSVVAVGQDLSDTSGILLVYSNMEPVSIILGHGPNVPIPQVELNAVVQYCSD